MRISSRFTEYGLTGALLLISQCIVFILISGKEINQNLKPLELILKTISEAFPSTFHPALMSVAAALSIVSIFFLGLCLDLLGTCFIFLEMNQFRNQLEKNTDWINLFVNSNKSFICDDYNKFMTEFGSIFSLSEWKPAFLLFQFWKKHHRQNYIDRIKRTVNRYRLISSFSRFHSFLVSFVMVRSGSANLELFFDQVHLWRTSRSISTILFIVAIELYLLKYLNNPGNIILFIVYVLLIVLSTLIALRSHGRMCCTLLSMVYTIVNKNPHD
jgi:hypothetical protein